MSYLLKLSYTSAFHTVFKIYFRPLLSKFSLTINRTTRDSSLTSFLACTAGISRPQSADFCLISRVWKTVDAAPPVRNDSWPH